MNPRLKNVLFFIFLLSNTVLNAQDLADGKAYADEDWALGIAKYNVNMPRGKKNDTLDCLYLEHLGVSLNFYECIRPPEGYNIRIKEKLKEKHGRDVFATLRKDTRAFYDSLDKLETRNAIFSKGDKHLLEYFKTITYFFKGDGKSKDLGNNFKITLSFTVNPKGKAKHLHFTQTESVEFNRAILMTFKRFFKYTHWLPAKQNGVRVAEEKTFDIVFNPH